jgi:hypothetical protein
VTSGLETRLWPAAGGPARLADRIPLAHAGEVPIAFAAESSPTADGLRAERRSGCPSAIAVPQYLEVVDEIPLNAVGMPFKPELRRRAAARAASRTRWNLGRQVSASVTGGGVEMQARHSGAGPEGARDTGALFLELEAVMSDGATCRRVTREVVAGA